MLFPRIDAELADAIALEHAGLSIQRLLDIGESEDRRATFPQVGAPHVPTSAITSFKARLDDVAREVGVPDGTPEARRQFDRLVMRAVHDLPLIPADAAAPGVWSFLSLIVVPWAGPWRFPSRERRRIVGNPRNVLQRLWWRGYLLRDPDTADPLERALSISEDAAQQIVERPGLSANPRVALRMARAWEQIPASGTRRDEIMRDTARRLIRLMPFICLDALGDTELEATIAYAVAESVAAADAKRPPLPQVADAAALRSPFGAHVDAVRIVIDVPPDFGERIRSARAAKGTSQSEVAAGVAVTVGHLADVENGRKRPSLDLYRRLVMALDLDERSGTLPAADPTDARG